ncbi:hypothetical protein PENFLA_c045G10963 [Penicillium flavigenum]|uniref:Reverse transcriptase domain-containing protein n=1 Tax=Penicillium flavigenum TaxID=254877 RepID=A0A1V6SHY6_9EURO|nr:hypothetical protein PENFLA_c045G10963 [Penicillium flavigenum]
MLLLDVAGAYDMVSHERLLFNMRQMRLGALILWVQSFLAGRSTRIKLPNGYLSEAFPTPTVRTCTLRGLHYGESEAYGWVDDDDIWEVPDDPAGHDGMPVIIPGDPTPTILAPIGTAKYLGIWLDKHLNFTTYRKKMLAKGASSLEALRAISGSTWGSLLIAMRKVYQAVIIPQMLWGLSAWYCPAARAMERGDLDKLTNELTKIQKRAAILISGAFRGTAGAALDTELFITPIKLRLQQIVEETTIRILTGPQWACPQTAKEARKPRERRIGGWAPTEAIAWKTLQLRNEKWEEKQAFILALWEARIPCFVENQEAALKTHNDIYKSAVLEETKDMFFTDGSGFAGHIGASMASLQHGVVS